MDAFLLLSGALLPLVAAPLVPVSARLVAHRAAWFAATIAAASALLVLAAGPDAELRAAWLPALGAEFALRADGFGLLMATLVGGVGAAILVYAGAYSRDDQRLGRLLAWLLAFAGAMQLLVLADDLLLLFAAWEATSFCSFMLVGHAVADRAAREAARRALLVTAAGGLCLLGGAVLAADVAGTWSLSRMTSLVDHAAYPAIALLFLVAAATKSAQVPFHFWLPGAMLAPTPVSAYLHSATMVKAGVVLMARMHAPLGGGAWWDLGLQLLGGATVVVATWRCTQAVDLKALLAATTLGALGCMTLLAGVGTPAALGALVILILAHALYKAAAFMVVGTIDHGTGTRDLRRLSGLRLRMPVTTALAALTAVAFAGLVPAAAFVAKELLVASLLAAAPWLLAVVLPGLAAFAYAALRLAWSPFAGPPSPAAAAAHEPVPSAHLALGMLALPAVGLGLLLAPGIASVAPAAEAIGGALDAEGLALWHGVTPQLVLGLGALALGLVAAIHHRRLRLALRPPRWIDAVAWHDAAWRGLLALARRSTRVTATGGPRLAACITLGVPVALVAWIAVDRGLVLAPPRVAVTALDLAAVALVVAGAVAAVVARSRMAAVCSLGAAGTGVSLLFLAHSAPDLALTQFLVEVLTVLLLMIAFRHLGDRMADGGWRRVRAAVALALGTTVALLVLVAQASQLEAPVGAWHAEQSVASGHGRNAVNVILVDFRALDTLGEIAVLAVAALGAGVLLARRGAGKAVT